MGFELKPFHSNRVPVTAAVKLVLLEANKARAGGDWTA
jgi:hypothetical protein